MCVQEEKQRYLARQFCLETNKMVGTSQATVTEVLVEVGRDRARLVGTDRYRLMTVWEPADLLRPGRCRQDRDHPGHCSLDGHRHHSGGFLWTARKGKRRPRPR